MSKVLNVEGSKDFASKTPDVECFGNPGLFVLLSKASSLAGNWMKSTKAMEVPGGCVIQVTTQQGDNVAEALAFVPNVKIGTDEKGNPALKKA